MRSSEPDMSNLLVALPSSGPASKSNQEVAHLSAIAAAPDGLFPAPRATGNGDGTHPTRGPRSLCVVRFPCVCPLFPVSSPVRSKNLGGARDRRRCLSEEPTVLDLPS